MRRFSPLLFFLIALTASVTQAQTPRSAGDYLHRGVARFTNGDLEGAIADYDRAIENGQRGVSNSAERHDARSARGDQKEVIVNRGRSLAVIPLAAAAYYDR